MGSDLPMRREVPRSSASRALIVAAIVVVPLLAVLVPVVVGRTRNEPVVPVYPVEGRIFVGDIPAADAQVAFHPTDAVAVGQVVPVGITGTDGTFHLTTHAAGDGAPPGDYVVTVFWPNHSRPFDECGCLDFSIHDRLGGLYAHRESTSLRATVRAESNTIVLRMAEPSRGWNLPKRREADSSDRPLPKAAVPQ